MNVQITTKHFISAWTKGTRLRLLGLGLLAISLAALLPVTVSFAQTVSFDPATNFAVGAHPYFVAIGDLDGDGKPDLAVANNWSDNVSVLLGTGTGSLYPATNFAVGSNPFSVAIGDLNGDGKPDLAVSNGGTNNVSILLGTGTGSFGPATNFAVGSCPLSVAIGDLNGDGQPDLAVANYVSHNVSILLGTGTGAFGLATNFAPGTGPYSVAIGDLNDDGKPDLAVANYWSNNVSILLGTGTGAFGPATNFPVGAAPFSVAIGDFNGDGKPDLAVVNFWSQNVSILLGDGAGAFDPATNFAVGTLPVSVAIGDLNGDEKPDLAVANWISSNVSILLGDGAGFFDPATNFAVGSNPFSVAIGDLNGDGKPDLAVANSDSDNASILLNTTVFPNQPPVANAGADQTVECTSPAGEAVTLDGSASSDPDNNPLTYEWKDAGGSVVGNTPILNLTRPLGTHVFTLTVNDGKGGTASDSVAVIVQDTTPPTLGVSLSPKLLWPPNHKLVPVVAVLEVSDLCDPSPTVVLVSIVSNEADSGQDVQGASVGTDDRSFLLRAERAGGGAGRVYTVTYRARDASGNMQFASANVIVPHDSR